MNYLQGITSETTMSLGFLLTALTAAATLLAFLFNVVRRGNKATNASVKVLGDKVGELRTTIEMRMLGLENRLDGRVSMRTLQGWILKLQRENPQITIPDLDFSEDGTAV